MKMFRQFPTELYWFDNKDEKYQFTNFFIKVSLLEYLKDNPKFLTNYILKGDERADVLAYNIYGNSDLYWTIYLVNEILDPRDWVMSQSRMNSFLKEKYLDEDSIAFTTRNGEYAQIESNRFMVEKNPFGTVPSSPDVSLTDPQTYSKISVTEAEISTNDGKRIVKAIRPEYMAAFLRDFERKVKSLEGK